MYITYVKDYITKKAILYNDYIKINYVKIQTNFNPIQFSF